MDLISALGTMNSLVYSIIPTLNRLVVFLVIIFVGFIIGKLLSKFIFTMFKDVGVDKKIKEILNKDYSLGKILSILTAVIIYTITLFMALEVFNLAKTVIIILLSLLLLLGLIRFIYYLIYFLPNLIARFNFDYQKGDSIDLNGFEGTVEKKGLIDINIRRTNGDLIIISYKNLLKIK